MLIFGGVRFSIAEPLMSIKLVRLILKLTKQFIAITTDPIK